MSPTTLRRRRVAVVSGQENIENHPPPPPPPPPSVEALSLSSHVSDGHNSRKATKDDATTTSPTKDLSSTPLSSSSLLSSSSSSSSSSLPSSSFHNRTKCPPLARIVRFSMVVIAIVAVTSVSIVSIVLVRAEWEKEAIIGAKSSMELYTNDVRVCAGHVTPLAAAKSSTPSTPGDVRGPFVTFPSAKDARRGWGVHRSGEASFAKEGGEGGGDDADADADADDRVVIAHCGGCGQCSTVQDMTIMAKTTRTLTDAATWCSTIGLLGSAFLWWGGTDRYRRIASKCMKESVGFTSTCQDCWMDDMVCTIQKCVFTCLKSVYVLREPKNGNDGRLNACLECDERLCGPRFLSCSGANRRRQGIRSDIERDDVEICRHVDIDWEVVG